MAVRVAALPCDLIDARMCRLHLGDGHGHRSFLAERPDPGLVEPRAIAMAGRSRAPVVNDLHR
jgi:hypothetical protein